MTWMKEMSEKEALNSLERLAKLLHVPVIHVSHKAVYAGENIKNPSEKVERRILGGTQIIDGMEISWQRKSVGRARINL